MSETINFINKLNESALTSDEPISDETKRFVKGISKEDRDAGKSFSTDDFNEFKKRLKANGLSKFTDKEYSELFDYYFKCYNDEAMKNLQKSKIIKENNLRPKKSLKIESKFDKVQATLPLDSFHSMGIIVSDDGETVQYMYSNDENSIYESEIEYDEEGNPYFKDENDNTWYLNEFMRTDYPKTVDKDDLKESDNNHKIKIGSKVYWVGVGNEIASEGEVIDFPVDGRMTIKWDDNEQNTYDITHPNIILADNYDNSVNESENKIDPNNLTSDQLSKLRKDITLNSTFTDDYKNSLGIDPQLVQNFFDGYIEYLSEMIQEDIGEDKYDELDDNDWYNYINKYDTLENLEHYYNAVQVMD